MLDYFKTAVSDSKELSLMIDEIEQIDDIVYQMYDGLVLCRFKKCNDGSIAEHADCSKTEKFYINTTHNSLDDYINYLENL